LPVWIKATTQQEQDQKSDNSSFFLFYNVLQMEAVKLLLGADKGDLLVCGHTKVRRPLLTPNQASFDTIIGLL